MADRAPMRIISPRSRSESQRLGLVWGSLIGDALAMPVHWYYDRVALRRDYGFVQNYMLPQSPHPDSILWRSTYTPLNERGSILHGQAKYWGQKGVHYHQFLHAGENTLNLQLVKVLVDSLIACDGYNSADYLRRYIDFMLTPGRHNDTYIEECHRNFFTAYARGVKPEKCGGVDVHIGGLAPVGVLCSFLSNHPKALSAAVQEHLQLTHRSPEVLKAAGALVQIINSVLAGGDLREAIFEYGSDWFSKRKAEQWSRESDEVVIGQRVSSACYIDDAFPASLFLAWKYATNFEAGIVANANVGGDNCHRGAVVGALLGVSMGIDGVPARFYEGLQGAKILENQLQQWPVRF